MKLFYIKWVGVAVGLLILWSWISGSVLLFLTTHHMQHVSPLFYWSAWLHLGLIPKVHLMLILSGLLSGLSLGIMMLLFLPSSVPNIYGKARFAEASDIQKAGLFAKEGILVGKKYGRFLRVSGYEHTTVFAPTGAGKTISVTLPNLFEWLGSCVVNDIKLQLFKLTSGFRKSIGQQVYLWNPADPAGTTHRFNPLDIIGDNPMTRIDEIQKIAEIFIPNNSKVDPMWTGQARFLLVALILYVLDATDLPKNITTVVRVYKSQKNFLGFMQQAIATQHNLDPICIQTFMKLAEKSEKTRTSITTTFESYFELFDNPLIQASTETSDFDIRNLRREKMTIYVGVTNDNLERLAPLLTAFYQQVTDVLTRKLPGDDEPHGVLFLMDEFSALNKMKSFHKNIGLYREYKMRMVIIIQELSQLYDIYGRDGAKVFINAKIRIAYTQNDEETCKLIESALGNQTLAIKQQSRNLSTRLLNSSNKTEATHYFSRPLILAQDIRLLPDNKSILLVQGHLPIYATKIAWFKEKYFKERMMGEVSIPSLFHNKKTTEVIIQSQSKVEDEPLDQVI